jgi:hypothetical protein
MFPVAQMDFIGLIMVIRSFYSTIQGNRVRKTRSVEKYLRRSFFMYYAQLCVLANAKQVI